MKRNKIRYKAAPVIQKPLQVSGKVYLEYVDVEALDAAQKGDFKVYPVNESLNTTRCGEYESTGFAGYFKVDIHDGWDWRLVHLNDIFPHKEHHFSKTERPIDTYHLCREILLALAGRTLLRTYREHYELQIIE